MGLPELQNLKFKDSGNFFLIAGPCVVEDEKMSMEIAIFIQKITAKLGIPYIFKASYRKANRTKNDSFTGIGDKAALELLYEVGVKLGIPTLTDIHTAEEAVIAANYVDILQIPAFLCRQTDLLEAAGRTGKTVNIKKGQFSSPDSMKFAIEKVWETENRKVMLTERGNMFGYHDLVVDFRNIPEMKKTGVPVIMDVTHSLQQPNARSGITGGRPDLIETIAKAAIAVGADGIFIETHPDPANAKSDGANMLRLDLLENLLEKLVKIRRSL